MRTRKARSPEFSQGRASRRHTTDVHRNIFGVLPIRAQSAPAQHLSEGRVVPLDVVLLELGLLTGSLLELELVYEDQKKVIAAGEHPLVALAGDVHGIEVPDARAVEQLGEELV
eukprot:3357916-Prymnesium_polylepis.1